MNKFIYFVLIIFTLISCNSKPKESVAPPVKTVEGLDMNGELRSCSGNTEVICDMSFGPGDQFAADCEKQGKKAIFCGCHDYICVDPGVRSGVDIDGNARTCSAISPDIMCTTEHTQGDQFADDCKKDGFEAFQCGCHDFICIKE